MKAAILFLSITTLLLPASVAADDWWQMIKRAGSACFSGRKFKVEIIAGASVRTLGDRARTGPFSEIRLTIPLWSKEKRQQEKRELASFLEHAADVLQQLRQAEDLLRVKSQQAKTLQTTMLQSGVEGINSWYSIRSEIAVLETTAKAAEMKLNGFLKACEVN